MHQPVLSPTRRTILAASAAAGAIGFIPATLRAEALTSVFGARQWLNTPPLKPEDFKGEVVLVKKPFRSATTCTVPGELLKIFTVPLTTGTTTCPSYRARRFCIDRWRCWLGPRHR